MNDPGTSAAACRERLDDLINESASQAARLEALLDAERDALKSQDAGRLDTIAAEKLRAVNELDRLEADRRDLAVGCGFDGGTAGMLELLSWCDDRGRLAGAWDALLTIAGRCRQRNQSNGAVARVRMDQIRGALAILSGNLQGSPVYDQDGRDSSAGGRRELARV